MWLERRRERRQVRNHNQNQSQTDSIITIVGEVVTRMSFASIGSERRMAKEWANKDRYHPFHGVPDSRMPLPRGKDILRKIPAWGVKTALGGTVRLVWADRFARIQSDRF
jgi:hypothetical protein